MFRWCNHHCEGGGGGMNTIIIILYGNGQNICQWNLLHILMDMLCGNKYQG